MQDPPIPSIDAGVRHRLTLRFGGDIDAWLAQLPDLLGHLAKRWRLEFGSAIPRGSVAAVFRCRRPDGRRAVLKVSPDRVRLESEARAIAAWGGEHLPEVFEFDDNVGALLIEEISPGTPLIESSLYPSIAEVAQLLGGIHAGSGLSESFPSVKERIDRLFDSSRVLYDLHPEIAAIVPPGLYERGHEVATELARDRAVTTVLLHGDLTPSNILDGGPERGLVAIDPSPCVGDAAFDAVDMILWNAGDLTSIEARTVELADATGMDPRRILAWSQAFAGMNALELAADKRPEPQFVETLVRLASR